MSKEEYEQVKLSILLTQKGVLLQFYRPAFEDMIAVPLNKADFEELNRLLHRHLDAVIYRDAESSKALPKVTTASQVGEPGPSDNLPPPEHLAELRKKYGIPATDMTKLKQDLGTSMHSLGQEFTINLPENITPGGEIVASETMSDRVHLQSLAEWELARARRRHRST